MFEVVDVFVVYGEVVNFDFCFYVVDMEDEVYGRLFVCVDEVKGVEVVVLL